MKTRIWLSASAFAAFTVSAGCANQSTPPAKVAVTPPPTPAVTDHTIHVTDRRKPPAAAPATDSLAAALAEKTAAFSKALNDTSTPPTEPPPVKWETPAATPAASPRKPRLMVPNTPAALPDAPAPKPALASAVLHPDTDDTPRLVPESSDFSKKSAPTDDFAAALGRRLRNNPKDLSAQLDNQLYELLRDDTESKWTSTSELSSDDRELVAAVIDGISNLRNGIRQDANAPMSKRVQPLTDMAERAKAQAGLSISNMKLCKHITGFGVYDPINPPRFPAGQPNPVLVYCELANFQSRLNANQMWETQLQEQVTVFTDTGMLAWKDDPKPTFDYCRNRRTDFCMYDYVVLPPNLTIGRYLVKMTIVDKLANRLDESTTTVDVVAK